MKIKYLLFSLLLLLFSVVLQNFVKEYDNTPFFAINDINYDSSIKNFHSLNITQPKKSLINKINFFNKIDRFELDFNFKLNSYQNYDNLFEILQADREAGVRIELSKINNLGLVYGRGKDILGSTIFYGIESEKEYNLKILYQKKILKLWIDGKPISVKQYKDEINPDSISIGYGFNKKRFFNGKIDNFNAKFYSKSFLYSILLILQVLASILVVLYLIVYLFKLTKRITFNIKSLLVFLILFTISVYPIRAYYEFELYAKRIGTPVKLTFKSFSFLLINEIKKDFKRSYKSQHFKLFKDSVDKLPIFNISIDKRYLNNLNEDLPRSGKEKRYPGFIRINNGSEIKMKLRYRGEGNYHWHYKKKSLRINLKKGSLYEMEKVFNLINPIYNHAFRDIANYKISEEIGIISPKQYPVKVYINDEYFGVYLYLSQVNENLIRKNKLMPGSIYYGDSGAPINSRGFTDLWINEKYWVKKGSRNKEQNSFRGDIRFFIDKINNSSERDFFIFFNKYIDKKTFYDYISIDRITGSSHHDANHNHKIYFDPYKGKFFPIQWDVRFWTTSKYKDPSYNPFIHRIVSNPILNYELDKVTYKHYQNDLEKRLYKIYKNELLLSEKALKDDPYLDKTIDVSKTFNYSQNYRWYKVPLDYNEQIEVMKKDKKILSERRKIMMDYFNNTDIKLLTIKGKEQTTLKYFVSGNSPVKIDFSNLKTKVYRLHKNKIVKLATNTDILYPGRKSIKRDENVLLMSDMESIHGFEEYTFILNGSVALDMVIYKNAITDLKVSPQYVDSFEKDSDSIHPWDLQKKDLEIVTFDGIVEVTEDLYFEENKKIYISPGTTFLIWPNKSIFFNGKVVAKGSKEFPINFLRKDIEEPWGVIVVNGEHANGSHFEYIKVSGGSIATNSLKNYSGQFNIHNIDNFLIKNSIFDKNSLGDDNLHVAYSRGDIIGSIFSNSLSDAVDIDIGNINVSQNIFINSGNDGLDIMTTNLNASKNVFINNGDKAISIGEWSSASIEDTIIYSPFMGLAVKDKSSVTVQNILIAYPKLNPISLYNKNIKYDEGGKLKLKNKIFIGINNISVDKLSVLRQENNSMQFSINSFEWFQSLDKLSTKNKILLKDLINFYEQ